MTVPPEAARVATAEEKDRERIESRQRVVHVVEYSPYPRRESTEDRRVAYTQDRSETGLGLDLPEPVEPGELLRVTLRDIDGGIDLDGLARVVWCQETVSGRARAGIAMLQESGERPMMRVRKTIRGVEPCRILGGSQSS